MAIRMMVDKTVYEKDPSDIEVISDFHGHETTRVCHAIGCPNVGKAETVFAIGEGCIPHNPPEKWGCEHFDPLYMKTTHKGVVLDLGEYNGYDDSDFYAVVWNKEKGEPERINYATTRGWSYPNGAAIDATPEIVALYSAWANKKREADRLARLAFEAKKVVKGKTVKVVKGRKIPIGTVAKVFWVGATKFGDSVGLETAKGREFTALNNVEVVL